ncbi:SUKH-4 family immunity protein [Streptomyces sp. NPDC001940]
MPDQTPNSAADHFGRDGMRRLSLSNLGSIVHEDVRAVLEQVGVPLVVAPYFAAAGETDGLTLGLYAGHHGLRCDESQVHWVRVGVDGLAHMAVSADGVVHAVFLDRVEPGMFVNSDVSAFSQCLAALDRRLGVIAASTDLAGGAAAFRELNAELRLIDSGAFEGRENWWPRVLDDCSMQHDELTASQTGFAQATCCTSVSAPPSRGVTQGPKSARVSRPSTAAEIPGLRWHRRSRSSLRRASAWASGNPPSSVSLPNGAR